MKIGTARVLAESKLERLTREGLETTLFWRRAGEVLRGVLPFDFFPCWFTVDPVNLLVTAHFNEGLEQSPPEIAQSWYAESDVNSPHELARSRKGATTLVGATKGDPHVSWRWRNLLAPNGYDDALDAVLRRGGTTWGAVNLLHTPDSPPFTRDDVEFLSRISPILARGTQYGLLTSQANNLAGPSGPAVVVAASDLSIVSATLNATAWLEDLPDIGPARPERLPLPLQVVVLRALRAPSRDTTVTVRSRSGRWLRIHGCVLTGERRDETAVIIEPASPPHTVSVLLQAYELTQRERQIVELVLRGRSTKQMAEELFISSYTVQDRLKSVFEKLGVRSRRELVALVHGVEYQPLIDANDTYARNGQPLLNSPGG